MPDISHRFVVATSDPELPVVFGRSDALAGGMSLGQVHRRLATGRWSRVRWGTYTLSGLDGDLRWRVQVLAVSDAHQRQLVLSHAHAARAWGLPRPLDGWGSVSFTSSERPGGKSSEAIVRVAPLSDPDLVAMGRILVTSAARTVIDCARTLPPRDALAIADAALHHQLCTLAELAEVCRRVHGWPGAPKARTILGLADGRRETALESWSAWSFSEHEVPAPMWQATLCDDVGAFLGRTDGWWKEGVAGEADGREKYGLAALERGGVDAEGLAAALDDERRREDRLRRAGVLVVRWTAGDVLDPGRSRRLATDLRAAIEHGGRFAGRVMFL
jgi:hypothetical protein